MLVGVSASKIAEFEVPNTICQFCNEESNQDISVYGRYMDVFWIPIFPMGKKAVAECTSCKKTIKKSKFTPELKQKYKESKSKIKRPFWHWLGLLIVGFLIGLVVLIATFSEKDPRSDLLDADVESMSFNPTMESDSISYKIKQVFDNFANEEIVPSHFEYLTKVVDEKALILVKIPKLRKVEKEGREEAIEMVEIITDNQPDLQGKDIYILV